MRNKARRKALKNGSVKKGDKKDVAHNKAISKGGTNKDGTRVTSSSANRSFDRNSKKGLVSETSPRERKRRGNNQDKALLIRTRRPELVTERIKNSKGN